MLETARAKLLFQDYENGKDGMLRIRPCTVVLLGDKTNKSAEQWQREAIIVQAPEGADLKFDSPLNIASGKFGNLVAGQLRGKFVIRSDQKDPDQADDLFVSSRDAQLVENRIVSPHPIQFRLGSSYGSGRELRIELIPGGSGQGGLAFNGISRIEMKREVAMHIEFAAKPPAAGEKSTQPARGGALDNMLGNKPGAPQPPLRITSRGPFEFDLVEYVAKFREHVDVLRLHPQGQSDSLKGELLSLFFAPVGAVIPGKFPKLDPSRIEVRGLPVIMESPSQQMRAQGEHLIYDFGTDRIHLEGKQPVSVERAGSRIEAPKLIYEPPADPTKTQFGRFSAIGPGKLHAVMPQRPDQVYRARWTKQALFGPDQDNHIVSLLGDASFSEPQTGSLQGEEIYVWLHEEPKGAKNPLLPERMLAQGRVHLDSPQLVCNVEMLQVWFVAGAMKVDPRIEELPSPDRVSARLPMQPAIYTAAYRQQQFANEVAPTYTTPSYPTLTSPTPTNSTPSYSTPTNSSVVPAAAYTLPPPENEISGPVAPPQYPTLSAPRPGRAPQNSPQPQSTGGLRSNSKYFVQGKLLQVELKLVPGLEGRIDAQPSQLRVQEKVRVTESFLGATDEAPLVLTGDQLDYAQMSQLEGILKVAGAPAHIEGRGMTLEGPVIRLNRATSELDVDGAGTLTLPADRDLEGHALAQPRPLLVDWQRTLHFDGRIAHLEDQVEAEFDGQSVRSQKMEVAFAEPVNFANPPRDGRRPEVADISCLGHVVIERSTLESGQIVAIERTECRSLRVNRPTGVIAAEGPGFMRTTRKGAMSVTNSTAAIPVSSRNAPEGLTYVRVDFPTRADGNINTREMTFGNSVETIFGPVTSWEGIVTVEDLDRLGPDQRPLVQQCGYLRSQQLSVAQLKLPNGANSLELDASGNATFEGFNFQNESFVAKGDHIKYAQEKELVILQGDGRNDAQLIRWNRGGVDGERATSRKIDFWLGNQTRPPRVYVDGARHIDLTMPPRANNPPPAASPFAAAAMSPSGTAPFAAPGTNPGPPTNSADTGPFGQMGVPGSGYSGLNSSP